LKLANDLGNLNENVGEADFGSVNLNRRALICSSLELGQSIGRRDGALCKLGKLASLRGLLAVSSFKAKMPANKVAKTIEDRVVSV
jgi:hypothetical protein